MNGKKVTTQATKTSQVKKAKDASKENKAPSQVQPKKPITPYFAFLAARRENFRNENPKLSITEIAKGMGQVWTAMTEDQKKPYNQIVEEDKARYLKELNDLEKKGFFINKDGVNSKDLQKEEDKKNALKNCVQPKKPQSAYIFFNQEMFQSLKAKNPDSKITELSKIIGE